jgi:hypothetical protein
MKMRSILRYFLFVANVLTASALVSSIASAQTTQPNNATARCRDGTYSTSTTRGGTCSRHGGVAEWLTGSTTGAPSGPPTAAPTKPATVATSAVPAGVKVWVNTASGVYHCPGTRWYGATKQGKYMTEAEAKAAGNRAAYGRACS